MLTSLRVHNVGPATAWDLPLVPRLNVLTGENGLGKTLILEAVWALLTGNAGRLEPWSADRVSQSDVQGSYRHETAPNNGTAHDLHLVFKPGKGWVTDAIPLSGGPPG